MKKYTPKRCNYCGSKVLREAIVNGIHYNNSCVNPDCREHGNENYDEELCEGLSVYNSLQEMNGEYDDDY